MHVHMCTCVEKNLSHVGGGRRRWCSGGGGACGWCGVRVLLVVVRARVCLGLRGCVGVGGGVHSGVRGVEDDESVERHTANVNNNFGEKKQWRRKNSGGLREAFGDG